METKCFICMFHNNQYHIELLIEALHVEFGWNITFSVEETQKSELVRVFADPCDLSLGMSMNNFIKGFRIGCNPDNKPKGVPTLITLTDKSYMVTLGSHHYIYKDVVEAIRLCKQLWTTVEV